MTVAPYCDVCQGTMKLVVFTIPEEQNYVDQETGRTLPTQSEHKEFDCPQCVPKVPYRKVRALKVMSKYPAGAFGKYHVPIERSLAARFGEYLLRGGLVY